jgi:hypothetical protein
MLGIDIEVDWAPTFGTERGSVYLPITSLRSSRIAGIGLTLAAAFQPWTLLHTHSDSSYLLFVLDPQRHLSFVSYRHVYNIFLRIFD